MVAGLSSITRGAGFRAIPPLPQKQERENVRAAARVKIPAMKEALRLQYNFSTMRIVFDARNIFPAFVRFSGRLEGL
jgi:hypothetical protein